MQIQTTEIAPWPTEWILFSKAEYHVKTIACCENAVIALSGAIACPECDI